MPNNPFPITVTYRRTSRLSISVNSHGVVRVSAPVGMSESQVAAFVEEKRGWIEQARRRMIDRGQKRSEFFDQLPLGSRAEREAVTARLNALIPPLVEQYSKVMGVHPAGISYSATTSKWGSCHVRTHRLQFSAYLLLLPEWCVEHVVVHELAHILVPNHGPRFHALMDKYFPRWREANKETRRLSRMEIEE